LQKIKRNLCKLFNAQSFTILNVCCVSFKRKPAIMNKRNCFLFLTITCVILFLFNHSYAKDLHTIQPVLIQDFPLPDYKNLKSATPEWYVSQNTVDQAETDDLDDELMEDYDDDEALLDDVSDPLYYFNYAMYGFNDFLYFAAIKPITQGYKAVTPTPVRKGVKNFFHNLLFPVRLVNNLLQWKLPEAGTEVEIFVINSTVGLLGFVQVAQEYHDKHTSDEDFGQTLGSYSMGEGFYLVWPILGPSTLRDTVGFAGDYFLKPVNYVEPWELSLGIQAYDKINTMSFHLGDYEALKEAAIEPYSAIKNAYIQNRNKKIAE